MGALSRLLLAALCLVSAVAWAEDQLMAPLPIQYPRSVPQEGIFPDWDLAQQIGPDAPLPMAPRHARQVARGKPVTGSAKAYYGSLALVTDGNKEAYEDAAVEISSHTQWVQIDLGRAYELWAVAVWHFHLQPAVFHDVVVQASNDPAFSQGVTTLFNNDANNSSGLGVGVDAEYWESHLGRVIEGKQTVARYVRLYSRGSTFSDPLNRYTEVEVWATEPTGPDWVPLPVVCPPAAAVDPASAAAACQAASALVGGAVDTPRTGPPPLVPPGCRQWARGRPVSASSKPQTGALAQVTDGRKEAQAGSAVELPPGSQWVQVDLGRERTLYYIGLWHAFDEPGTIVCGVLVQVSNDPTFSTGVTTLHNSDRTGCHGQDRGQDPFYFESNLGRLINAGGVNFRYVRCWSAGSTCGDARNRWTEIEAWGL